MEIAILLGDITEQHCEAIVNAANSSLLGGGGVDGAIHRAAGPELLEECTWLRETILPEGLDPGKAVTTSGHELPCEFVVHTVGPNRHRGETDVAVLESCFVSVLEHTEKLELRSIAFPAIGAGVYGWDGREVAEAARRALDSRVWEYAQEIRFVLFNDEVFAAFAEVFGDVALVQPRGDAGATGGSD